jgi:hypothetical protein
LFLLPFYFRIARACPLQWAQPNKTARIAEPIISRAEINPNRRDKAKSL